MARSSITKACLIGAPPGVLLSWASISPLDDVSPGEVDWIEIPGTILHLGGLFLGLLFIAVFGRDMLGGHHDLRGGGSR